MQYTRACQPRAVTLCGSATSPRVLAIQAMERRTMSIAVCTCAASSQWNSHAGESKRVPRRRLGRSNVYFEHGQGREGKGVGRRSCHAVDSTREGRETGGGRGGGVLRGRLVDTPRVLTHAQLWVLYVYVIRAAHVLFPCTMRCAQRSLVDSWCRHLPRSPGRGSAVSRGVPHLGTHFWHTHLSHGRCTTMCSA